MERVQELKFSAPKIAKEAWLMEELDNAEAGKPLAD
jgi:hypothetical protein